MSYILGLCVMTSTQQLLRPFSKAYGPLQEKPHFHIPWNVFQDGRPGRYEVIIKGIMKFHEFRTSHEPCIQRIQSAYFFSGWSFTTSCNNNNCKNGYPPGTASLQQACCRSHRACSYRDAIIPSQKEEVEAKTKIHHQMPHPTIR
jgi:hypothetical protein